MKKLIIVLLVGVMTTLMIAEEKMEVSVFYKERQPSQKVLIRVDSLLVKYQEKYDISYYNIEDEKNAGVITKFGLPETHFPFAIAIDGKYTAEVDGVKVHFVHFPVFMQGIGRHEGDWTIIDLQKVLDNILLLNDENVLPKLDESSFETKCDGE